MIIVGVDPGKVTGISMWCINCQPLLPETAEVSDSSAVPKMIRRMAADNDTCHCRIGMIGCERFVTPTSHGALTAQPHARQICGAVESLAADLNVRCLFQGAGPAKKIAPTSLLKKIGWYVATPDQHTNHATCQLLLVIATFFPDTFAELVGI